MIFNKLYMFLLLHHWNTYNKCFWIQSFYELYCHYSSTSNHRCKETLWSRWWLWWLEFHACVFLYSSRLKKLNRQQDRILPNTNEDVYIYFMYKLYILQRNICLTTYSIWLLSSVEVAVLVEEREEGIESSGNLRSGSCSEMRSISMLVFLVVSLVRWFHGDE